MKKYIALLLAILAAAILSGCVGTPRPIKTDLSVETAPAFGLSYSSEKDVLYSRTSTDPETGVVEQVDFKALASAVAYAQAEREKIDAEATRAGYEALGSAVQALGNNAASVLGGQPSAPPTQ